MKTHILGFPSIGKQRELKFALESFWQQQKSEKDLQNTAENLKQTHWNFQKSLDFVATGDFSFYDRMLDTAIFLNAIPERFKTLNPQNLNDYSQMARGDNAMEMTKWFNTNYHYLVPELSQKTDFAYNNHPVLKDSKTAKALGLNVKPAIIGPITFLALSKVKNGSPFDFLPAILPIYQKLLKELAEISEVIQIEEPILVCDSLPDSLIQNLPNIYEDLNNAAQKKLILTAYFGDFFEKKSLLTVDFFAIHCDCCSQVIDLKAISSLLSPKTKLSLGIVNGRNIWKNDYQKSLKIIQNAQTFLGNDRILLGTSSSLLHVPFDLASEVALPEALKGRMAFAVQKCAELEDLKTLALDKNPEGSEIFKANQAALDAFQHFEGVVNPLVRERVANIAESDEKRTPFIERQKAQKDLNLPLLPTTTIGSFPQTSEIRKVRQDFKKGNISAADYQSFLKKEIANCIAIQEKLGLDVLVHGEPERNDMVEYFGEQLGGFCFTANAWVQSYGSRCVKPPVIFGDVFRKKAMTLEWITYAQSLSAKHVKGMLTGPITILCWSFVREDLPRDAVALQIALAIRDEVADLEKAGVRLIQIDEAALREGMPLSKAAAKEYLEWATRAFRVTAGVAADKTQIHTHMCYSEFNAILSAIAQMDADVISIEASRSAMELLSAFHDFHYVAGIGPGVYDIHSPAIPSEAKIEERISEMLKILTAEQLWINPDCGLKTRRWEEVLPALKNMVAAAQKMREKL